jgi:Flp pilus assembly protein TadD
MAWRRILLWSLLALAMSFVFIAAYIGFQLHNYALEEGASGPLLAGRQARAEHDMENASRYFAMALARAPDDERIRNEAFTVFLMNGDMDRVVPLAEVLRSDRDKRLEASIVLLVDAVRSGNYERAGDILEQIPDGPAAHLLTPIIRAWLDYAENQTVSEARLKHLLNMGPFLTVTSHQAAILYELTGDMIAAEAAYERGLQTGGAAHEIFALSYGEFLERRGEDEKANRLYAFMQEAHANSPALAMILQRRATGAAPNLLVSDIPFHLSRAFLEFVDALRKDGHAGFAQSYVQLALYLSPSDAGRLMLADLAAGQDYWREAIRLYDAVSTETAFRRTALIRQSQMHEFAGDTDQAIKQLQTILNGEPDDTDVLVSLADIYRRADNFAQAETYYVRAFDLLEADKGADWGLWFSLGICRERLGKWSVAELDLKKARQLSNDDPVVLNYLGYSWIEKGIHLAEAEALVQLAVRKEPSNGFYVDSLGWLYFRRGEFETALMFLEKASQLEPTDPVITDHLGDVLWRLNRRTEARYQWRKALAFDPPEDLKSTLDKKMFSGLGEYSPEERAI